MNNNNSLSHTTWNCKYHIVFAPKYRRKVAYGKLREYIRNQLQEDLEYDQMTIKEYVDPFTGEPVKKNKTDARLTGGCARPERIVMLR